MKLIANMKRKDCAETLRQSLDSRLMLGQERYVGWAVGPFFSIAYYSGREFGKRNYPIFNKALGIFLGKKNETEICYLRFKGLTDPVSLLLLYVATYIIVSISQDKLSFTLLQRHGMAAACVAISAVITFLFTLLSEAGEEGGDNLESYIRSIFQD